MQVTGVADAGLSAAALLLPPALLPEAALPVPEALPVLAPPEELEADEADLSTPP